MKELKSGSFIDESELCDFINNKENGINTEDIISINTLLHNGQWEFVIFYLKGKVNSDAKPNKPGIKRMN